MATLNVCGFECESNVAGTELHSTGGTSPTVQTTTVKFGRVALRVNPAANAAGWGRIGNKSGTGKSQAFALTAETFYTFWFRFAALPAANADIGAVVTSTGSNVLQIQLLSTGALRIFGTAASSNAATLSTNTWYRIDVRCTSNGTSYLKVDGGTEVSCTANNVTQGFLQLGRTGTSGTPAIDFFYDGIVISASAAPPTGYELKALYPTGAGRNTGWTNGTGNTFAEVDDWASGAHDTDTTYIGASSAQSNAISDFDLTTCPDASQVVTVVGIALTRTDSTVGNSSIRPIMYDETGTEVGTVTGAEEVTTYGVARCVGPLDASSSGAWSTSKVNGITFGVACGSVAQAQRCTALLVYVLYKPGTLVDATPIGLRLSTVAPTNTILHTGTPVGLRLSVPAPTVTVRHTATPTGLRLSTVAATPRLSHTGTPTGLRLATVAPGVEVVSTSTPIGLRLSVPAPTVTTGAPPQTPDPITLEFSTVAPSVEVEHAATPVGLRLSTVAPTPRVTARPDPVGLELTPVAPVGSLATAQQPVGLRLSVPTPTRTVTVQASPVGLRVTVPAPTVSLRASPAPVGLRLQVPTPGVIGGSTVQVDSIRFALTVVAPGTGNLSGVVQTPIALRLHVPAPTVTLGISTTPVALRLSVPAVTISRGVSPDPVRLPLTVPAPSLSLSGSVIPIRLALSIPSATPSLSGSVFPIALVLRVPAPVAITDSSTPLTANASHVPILSSRARQVATLAGGVVFAPTLSGNASSDDPVSSGAIHEPAIEAPARR